MTENRATEYLPRCYGVYSDISCGNYPYRRYEKEDRGCIYALHEDALALLKEQEAVVPILIREARNKNFNDYVCPRCDNEVVYEQNYCSECGVKFMWEGR